MHASIPSLRPIVSRCNRDRTSLATPAAFLAPTDPFPPPPSRSIVARAICLRVDEWNYGGLESGSAIKRRIDNLHPLSLSLSFLRPMATATLFAVGRVSEMGRGSVCSPLGGRVL